MAIYHLHCDIIGRSGGRSATAAAAYRATEEVEDRTTGETFDYTKKEKALYTEIMTNSNAPGWARNRAELWNRVEEKENRKNSQFCRSFDIALMKELPLETNIRLVKKWIYENYVKRGLAADLAIHAPHKNRDGTTNENLHAHVLVTTRKLNILNADGWAEKDREGNDRDFLRKARTSWAEIVNAEFARMGMAERIDERTLEEQGIDREPQQHQGATATALERKGKNARRKKYKSQEQSQEKEISVSETELQTALQDDQEYKKLSELRKEAVKEKRVSEVAAGMYEHYRTKIVEAGGNRKMTNEVIEMLKCENVYHYVRQNSQTEKNFWQSLKSKDSRDRAYNKGLDDMIVQVGKICGHDKFDREIYPTVKNYCEEVSSPHYDKNGHWQKIQAWIKTTDFPPVKVCRLAIEKLRSWRDERFPNLPQNNKTLHR